MDVESKILGLSKGIKVVGVLLGIVLLLLASASLFLKTEDETKKNALILFGALGIVSIAIMVFAVGLAGLMEETASIPKKNPGDESGEDMDILA